MKFVYVTDLETGSRIAINADNISCVIEERVPGENCRTVIELSERSSHYYVEEQFEEVVKELVKLDLGE